MYADLPQFLFLLILAASRPIASVDSHDIARLLARDANLLLIDFRPAPEFDQGHLPFAVRMEPPNTKDAQRHLADLVQGRERPIVLYGLPIEELLEAAGWIAERNEGAVSIFPAGVEGWRSYQGGYLEIEWTGLWSLLTQENPLVLDLRDRAAFETGHIPGAQWFDETTLNMDAPPAILRTWRKDDPILTYCGGEACATSRKVADRLSKAGFKRVYQFPGGYPEWVERTACLRKP